MDEDCLATPDPTSSMFLYWINTNRMGTAKINDFCIDLWIRLGFFWYFLLLKIAFINKNFELVCNLKNGKRQLSMQLFLKNSSILPDCPGKRTASKKNKKIGNTNNMQHFWQPGQHVEKTKGLAYHFSKLACGGGGSVYQGKIQCILPRQCEQTFVFFFKKNKTNKKETTPQQCR